MNLFDIQNQESPTYSVSEISSRIKITLENGFQNIKVKGEVSGLKLAPSGHLYFSLKDGQSVLDIVCWRGKAQNLKPKPQDGMEVVCVGKITAYGGRSKYQMVLDSLEHSGEGALLALLEKRKKMLSEEGLFNIARKKQLPRYPQTIGVITSPTGAVIQDILHRLADRYPTHVLLWPVLVQGEGAAEQITSAIQGFNALQDKPDVLIVARGGGSLEDLWCFNEENVVRAAADSTIPLISAVGHETDTTLIDYAADVRAPTPTAAAELAVPVRSELLLYLQNTQNLLSNRLQNVLERAHLYLRNASARLMPPDIDEKYQRLDDLSERLKLSLFNFLQNKTHVFKQEASHFDLTAKRLCEPYALKLERAATRFDHLAPRLLEPFNNRFDRAKLMLDAYSYERVLDRGFALVGDESGHVVQSSLDAQKAEKLNLQFKDGKVTVKPIH